ncbi:flagellar biosynthesis protein FlhB, partial [Treponema pallidum]
FVMLFTSTSLFLLAPFILRECIGVLRFFFTRATTASIQNTGWFFVFVRYFMKLALPISFVALVSGVAANIVQNKTVLFSVKSIRPQFKKISPDVIRFFKRSFFSTEGLFNLLKSLIKITAIFFVSYFTIRNDLFMFVSLLGVSLTQSIFYITSLAGKVLLEVSLLLVVFSLPDYFFQRRQFIDSLKMSRQEVKEELKEQEGDPLVRSYVRKQMQSLVRESARNTTDADVVITNPTHFAVAVQYEPAYMTAPTVVAKGSDGTAYRIKRLAKEAGILIEENKPLARALYTQVAIGREVPYEYFNALVLIFTKLDKFKTHAQRKR